LIIRDNPEKADAIHVLGGARFNYPRVKQAISLYRSGVADTLIFSSSGSFLSDATQLAQNLGFPRTKMIILDSCTSTMSEALMLKKLNKKWKSVVLVTDPYHTRRSVRTFQKIMPGVVIYSRPGPNSAYHNEHWWKTEAGCMAVFEEMIKIVFYFIQYGVNPL
jgi:uncharacterized SAM-binding protein YcdF (DUF218 family)